MRVEEELSNFDPRSLSMTIGTHEVPCLGAKGGVLFTPGMEDKLCMSELALLLGATGVEDKEFMRRPASGGRHTV